MKVLNIEKNGKYLCKQCRTAETKEESRYYAYYNVKGELVAHAFCCYECMREWLMDD